MQNSPRSPTGIEPSMCVRNDSKPKLRGISALYSKFGQHPIQQPHLVVPLFTTCWLGAKLARVDSPRKCFCPQNVVNMCIKTRLCHGPRQLLCNFKFFATCPFIDPAPVIICWSVPPFNVVLKCDPTFRPFALRSAVPLRSSFLPWSR